MQAHAVPRTLAHAAPGARFGPAILPTSGCVADVLCGSMAGVFGLARDRLGDLEATGRAFDRGGKMTAATEQVSRLLHEAGETCHRVFRIVDGAEEDWASWYSDWLVNLS